MNTRVLAVLVPALSLGGYAGAQQTADSPKYVRDEAVRASMFVPLDLPTPSEVRLGSGAPGPAYWQQRCDYVIDATLDAEKRAISATARITYTNNSPHTLDYIWMSLEQNLFNQQSEGARMTLPGGRFGNRDAFEGGYKVGAVRLEKMSWRESSFSPVRSTRFEARDAELKIYDTLAKLDLPTPMAPGATLEFSISWSFNIPPYGSDRLGIYDAEQGPVFQVAQWFPSVCVYDDVHGWNTLQYLGAGEFYTDFGDYTVNLTLPHDHIAVCTGELMNPQDVLTSEQQQRLAQAKRSRETVTIIGADEVGKRFQAWFEELVVIDVSRVTRDDPSVRGSWGGWREIGWCVIHRQGDDRTEQQGQQRADLRVMRLARHHRLERTLAFLREHI